MEGTSTTASGSFARDRYSSRGIAASEDSALPSVATALTLRQPTRSPVREQSSSSLPTRRQLPASAGACREENRAAFVSLSPRRRGAHVRLGASAPRG